MTHLQVSIADTDINTSHRIGPKPNNQTVDRRSFIVKFCRRDLKRELIAASKRMKNRNFYISENLTPTRRNIFKTLRNLKREHPDLVKGVSVYEGKVFAYTKSESNSPNPRDKRHLLNSMDSLSLFCENYVKKPLEDFLSEFRS